MQIHGLVAHTYLIRLQKPTLGPRSEPELNQIVTRALSFHPPLHLADKEQGEDELPWEPSPFQHGEMDLTETEAEIHFKDSASQVAPVPTKLELSLGGVPLEAVVHG
jgi:hypothetical protein